MPPLTVHDELVFDLPKRGDLVKELETSRRCSARAMLSRLVFKELMEQGGKDFGVPTPVSVEYHATNWSEGASLA